METPCSKLPDYSSVVENTISVRTDDSAKHDTFWLPGYNRGSAVFKVRTCGQALIALATTPGDTTREACEVRLGTHSNTKSELVCGAESDVAETHDILSCYEGRAFWVSYTGITFEVGYGGHAKRNVFLSLTSDAVPWVNALSFAASGADGVWTINKLGG